MITDIPTADGFYHAGVEFINLAVNRVFELYEHKAFSDIEGWGDQNDLRFFWSSS